AERAERSAAPTVGRRMPRSSVATATTTIPSTSVKPPAAPRVQKQPGAPPRRDVPMRRNLTGRRRAGNRTAIKHTKMCRAPRRDGLTDARPSPTMRPMPHQHVATSPEPCVLVIFGASGDLTERKLIPSLFDMFSDGSLPESFAVVGCSRTSLSDAEFRERILKPAKENASSFDPAMWDRFARRVHYQPLDATRA